MSSITPKAFISYSREEKEHELWVKELADKLISDGIDASVDQYDLQLGNRLPQFMEQSITNSDYVLIICTPIYKKKSDARIGGGGYEGHIISGELFSKGNEKKFIPVVRKGRISDVLPVCLQGKYAIDFSDSTNYELNYPDLITTLFGKNKKPIIGRKPAYVLSQGNKNKDANYNDGGPIRILGIITDEVTVPKMDGTGGSALYKIPFRLSKRPSKLWTNIFLQEWEYPSHFTCMHRPGIASVYGDQIILDGTTIEEVRDYHRETLILCIENANKKEKMIIEEQQKQEIIEQQRKNDHYTNVDSIANDIKF